FARGSARRRSRSRSFASFFRYSSEARSGSFAFAIDAFLPFLARRPHHSGWKSGSLTEEILSGGFNPLRRPWAASRPGGIIARLTACFPLTKAITYDIVRNHITLSRGRPAALAQREAFPCAVRLSGGK